STGCSGNITKPAFIFIGVPAVDFIYSPNRGCAPLNVSFTDNTVGAATGATYSWDFGDGGTSTSANPTHTYAIGTYSVKEIVINPSGCGDTVTKSNIIYVTKPYKASFYADSILCQPPFKTRARNTSGANTHVLFWNFGDGSSSDTTSTHIYSSMPQPPNPTSPYTVSVTVEDNNTCIEQATKSNYIYAQATTVGIVAAGSTNGCVPFTIPFTCGVSTIDPVKTYSWHFGDFPTDSSNAQNPGNHTYRDSGMYTVTLSVVTNTGCRASTSEIINAGYKPKASFIGGPY